MLFVHLRNDLMLPAVQDLFIIYFIKVLQIDLVFVFYCVVDEAVPLGDVLGHWRRNVVYFRFVEVLQLVLPGV